MPAIHCSTSAPYAMPRPAPSWLSAAMPAPLSDTMYGVAVVDASTPMMALVLVPTFNAWLRPSPPVP